MARRTVIVLVTMFFLALGAPHGRANAWGSVTVCLEAGGQPLADVPLQLYMVGTPVQGGYVLTEEFGGGFLAEADVLTPEVTSWLEEEAETGLCAKTDSTGTAVFQPLEEGLYLITQQGPEGKNGLMISSVLSLPWDGSIWDLTLWPAVETGFGDNPDTGDSMLLPWSVLGMCCSGLMIIGMMISGRKKKAEMD